MKLICTQNKDGSLKLTPDIGGLEKLDSGEQWTCELELGCEDSEAKEKAEALLAEAAHAAETKKSERKKKR